MRNIMVTGGAGFIGSNFVRYLLDKYPDYRVVVYDKLTYAGNLDNLQDVADDPRYAFVQGDICDAAAVDQAMRDYQIDTIVNFAAATHVDRSLMEPDEFLKTDVSGTYVLLEAARSYGSSAITRSAPTRSTARCWRDARPRRPPAHPQPLLGQQGRRRPDVPGLLHQLRRAGDHHARLQQRRAVPVPGEGGAAVRHQRHRRQAAAALRRRQADARLPVRAGPLRGHRRRAAPRPAGRDLQRGHGQRDAQHRHGAPDAGHCWASRRA